MKKIEEIERSLRQLESAGEPAIHQRILDGLVSEMEEANEQAALAKQGFWKSALQSSLVRIGAPAGAVALLIAVATIGLRPVDAQAVMTQVAAKVGTIGAEVYKVHTKTIINDGPANEAEALVYHSAEHGSRHDVLEGGRVIGATYMLPGEKQIVSVNHSKKEYIRRPLAKATAEQLAGLLDVRHWLDTMVAEGKRTSGVEFLGKKKMDGLEVMGFALDTHGLFGKSMPSAEGFMRLWVDAKEHLPVLMEIEYTQQIRHRNGRHEKRTVSVTSLDFEWDVRLGPDTFEPDIPADYSLVQPGSSHGVRGGGKKDVKIDGDGPDVSYSGTRNGP